ncbi:hypothetical protein OPKNFCMD_0209 [Methylobacterium crusticola]|uniref:diguanylate cyclase n=1 Tax=Methylobacterium crusticola TaxID=1697972 RepID=A0ABQ4QR14_9HYPH|nr:sensor domain-containing diguanylate cyclase [Methylobacterium crusticola]GJD47501.1 hypothetical protein OPKNFCMD_0209 [Methylobacterium crusticola]
MPLASRLRFEHQLAALVGLLCLVLVGTTAGGAIWIERRAAIRLVEANMAQLAATMASILDGALRERFREVQTLAGLEPMRPLWHAAPATVRTVLDALHVSQPDYAWIGFVGPDGTVRSATQRLLEGASVAGRPWFAAGLRGPALGDVHEAVLLAGLLGRGGEAEPFRLVDLAAPVRDADGAVTGVLGAHLSWAWAETVRRRLLAQEAPGDGTEIWILDRTGRVVLGRDLGSVPFPPAEVAAMAARDRGALAAGTLGEPPGEPMLAGFAVAGASASRRGEGASLGWIVVARRPAALALAPVGAAVRGLSALAAAVAAAGIALAWLIGRRAAAPLRQMTLAADRIGRDPSATMLPRLGGAREFVALSAALRSLLRRLGVAERELSAAEARSTLSTAAYRREIEALRLAVGTDSLTGLLNRRGFTAPAEEAFAQVRSARRGVAVLVADIDHFKRVNDVHGHAAGDAVIRSVGNLLAETLRATDTVARFGGEEFVVLLRGLGAEEAAAVAGRLCAAVRAAATLDGPHRIAVTISIGVAVAGPEDADIQAVIARADAALYAAKARGRDGISVAAHAAIERAA